MDRGRLLVQRLVLTAACLFVCAAQAQAETSDGPADGWATWKRPENQTARTPRIQNPTSTKRMTTGGGKGAAFLDEDEFVAFNLENGKLLKGVEDFEPPVSNVGFAQVAMLADPLLGGVANTDAVGLGFPDGLLNLNLIIQSNVVTESAPEPMPGSGLAVLGQGFADGSNAPNSVKVGAALFADSLDLIFNPDSDISGVGLDIEDPVGGIAVITVFDRNNALLLRIGYEVPTNGDKFFFGMWWSDGIGRINVGGGGGEVVDNIQMWKGFPPIPGFPKWTQFPHPSEQGFDVESDLDWVTLDNQVPGTPGPGPNAVTADDFISDGRPINWVRWWGSYLDPAFEPGARVSAPSPAPAGNVRPRLDDSAQLPSDHRAAAGSCGPGTGACCAENGTPGCDDTCNGEACTGCCDAVCASDPFCCDTEWDGLCADEACGLQGLCVPICPGDGDCYQDNGTPGCEDTACCVTVCDFDAYCCDVTWDDICAADAFDLCAGHNIDGWLVSFHADVEAVAQPGPLLGSYFCAAEIVSLQPTATVGADGHLVYDYVVDLADCCLEHSLPDPRDGSQPAQMDAFYEVEDFVYWLDIQAVVGHTMQSTPPPMSGSGGSSLTSVDWVNTFTDDERAALFAASPATPSDKTVRTIRSGGLITFSDQAAFEAFVAGEGKMFKGVEDYEASVLPPEQIEPLDDPLAFGVPNGDAYPNGTEGLPNLLTQSNFQHMWEMPNPRGNEGLVAASIGSFGVLVSDVVVTNFQADSLDLIFTTEDKTAVGFNPISGAPGGSNPIEGGIVEIRFFDTDENLLLEVVSPTDPTGSFFFGAWSPVPIGRINIFNPSFDVEGADNIQAWFAPPGQCVELETPNRADDPFWGWHTSPTSWNDNSTIGQVLMGLFGEWLYLNWLPVDGADFGLPRVDQAFQLLSAFSSCPWDCDGSNDGEVSVEDLLTLISQWGTADSCDSDFNGEVEVEDLLAMVANWGFCSDCFCSADAIPEGEPCGADTNGGCNSTPPIFTPAACGDLFCGSAWADGGMRDTDWYLVDLPDPDGDGVEVLSATLDSRFPGLAFIIEGLAPCAPVVVGDIGCSENCTNIQLASATLAAPGTYVVFVATGTCDGGSIFDGYPCTPKPQNEYRVQIDCAAAPPCNPLAGGCCSPNGTPGCSDPECCELGCANDPFCCDTEWDDVCAAYALANCDVCTPSVCGPGNGDCCIVGGNGTPGCEDVVCCQVLCASDPFCCETEWDGICAGEAAKEPLCGCPLGPAAPPDGYQRPEPTNYSTSNVEGN